LGKKYTGKKRLRQKKHKEIRLGRLSKRGKGCEENDPKPEKGVS